MDNKNSYKYFFLLTNICAFFLKSESSSLIATKKFLKKRELKEERKNQERNKKVKKFQAFWPLSIITEFDKNPKFFSFESEIEEGNIHINSLIIAIDPVKKWDKKEHSSGSLVGITVSAEYTSFGDKKKLFILDDETQEAKEGIFCNILQIINNNKKFSDNIDIVIESNVYSGKPFEETDLYKLTCIAKMLFCEKKFSIFYINSEGKADCKKVKEINENKKKLLEMETISQEQLEEEKKTHGAKRIRMTNGHDFLKKKNYILYSKNISKKDNFVKAILDKKNAPDKALDMIDSFNFTIFYFLLKNSKSILKEIVDDFKESLCKILKISAVLTAEYEPIKEIVKDALNEAHKITLINIDLDLDENIINGEIKKIKENFFLKIEQEKKKIKNTINKLKNDKSEKYFINRSAENEKLEQILEILKYFDPINFYYDSNLIPKSSRLIIKNFTSKGVQDFFRGITDSVNKLRFKIGIDSDLSTNKSIEKKITEIENISNLNFKNEKKKEILNLLFFEDEKLEKLRSFSNKEMICIFNSISCEY